MALASSTRRAARVLAERDRLVVKRRLRAAWAEHDHAARLIGRRRLQTLTGELEWTHPGAAGSLRKGLDETLTLTSPGHHRLAEARVRVDEPVRIDDRVRPPH